MDINLILGAVGGAIITFLSTKIGRKFMVFLYQQLGELTDKTETDIDDKVHQAAPDFLDAIIENFDLGTTEKILEGFLKELEDVDGDTTEMEEEIKKKREDIKKD